MHDSVPERIRGAADALRVQPAKFPTLSSCALLACFELLRGAQPLPPSRACIAPMPRVSSIIWQMYLVNSARNTNEHDQIVSQTHMCR